MMDRFAIGIGLAAMLLLPGLVSAQGESGRFAIKIHAGAFGSQVGGDGLSGFHKLNIGAGLGVTTPLDESFHLEMELNVVQKGSKRQTDPDQPSIRQYKMDLWYVQVPVLVEYRYNDKFGGAIGPAIGVMVHSKETDYYGEISNQPEFNDLDFSLVIGGRYYLSDRFTAELRLDQSLLPIRSRGSSAYAWLEGRQYNTVLGVFLSYYFR